MLELPQLTNCLLALKNKVLTLTFNRHDIRNAVTGSDMVNDIVTTVDWANCNKQVSVLIITGAGSAFSSGGNVKDMSEKAGPFAGDVADLEEHYRRGVQQITLAISRAEMPVIAAVNGPAIGAGFDVANMCDIRIASTKAKFGETFINLGLIPGDGGGWFMQRLIGYQRAAELTFTGRIIDATEAKAIGVVLDVVEPEQLLDRTNELANEIASKPSAALRLTKRLMKLAQRTELPDFLDICAAHQGMSHNNPQHMEAVQVLLEKMAK